MGDDSESADVRVKDEVVEKPASSSPRKSSSSAAKVTNNAAHPVSIGGVEIAPGESVEAPKLDANHPVVKAWVKAKVISVS